MKTSSEMIQYAEKQQKKLMENVSFNFKKGIVYESFHEIEKVLLPNEDVLYCFAGKTLLKNDVSSKLVANSNLFGVAVALTNKRIIFGGHIAGFWKATTSVQYLKYDNINSINEEYSPIGANVVIETLGDWWRICVESREIAGSIRDNLWSYIQDAKKLDSPNDTGDKFSSADEIIKFKSLLDSGIITQEEFEIKKKQLLGL